MVSLHRFPGPLRSRLSRQIVSWVFLSLMVVEGSIFIPSFYLRRQERLRALETRSTELLTAVKASTMVGNSPAEVLEVMDDLWMTDPVILGASLYDEAAKDVGGVGNVPPLLGTVTTADMALRQFQFLPPYYDVAWPISHFQGSYVLVVRHDARDVQQDMLLYLAQVLGLMVLSSLFVTGVTILVLERMLINPLLDLRADLLLVGEQVSADQLPPLYSLSSQRNDELGDVATAFGQMVNRVQQEIQERKQVESALLAAQQKSDRLLANMLPASIAEQLKQNTGAIACRYDAVTILFADIVDFTGLSARYSPTRLVELLNQIFSTFDDLASMMGLEKIKTIGDAYMVVGGLPTPTTNHAEQVMVMAMAMLAAVRTIPQDNGRPLQLRIGINTGPVVAGVIGRKKFSYDLWGDAVNIASRMESQGVAGHIQVSPSTYHMLKHRYPFKPRGSVSIKGRGDMTTYLYCPPGVELPVVVESPLLSLQPPQ